MALKNTERFSAIDERFIRLCALHMDQYVSGIIDMAEFIIYIAQAGQRWRKDHLEGRYDENISEMVTWEYHDDEEDDDIDR